MRERPANAEHDAEPTSDGTRTAARISSVAPLVVVGLAVAAGGALGVGYAVLVLAAGTLIAAIGGFWTSLRALFGASRLTTEEAFAIGAPTAEEEQKRAVLRAIKDLEFEHGVGKISDADFKVLMARYRREARQLLKRIDTSHEPDRARAERIVNAYLVARGIASSEGAPSTAAEPPPDEELGTQGPEEAPRDADEDEAPGTHEPREAPRDADDDDEQVRAEASA
ncbi:MAG: hypothetical protein AAF715_15570 [Myxococcota bacterium]